MSLRRRRTLVLTHVNGVIHDILQKGRKKIYTWVFRDNLREKVESLDKQKNEF